MATVSHGTHLKGTNKKYQSEKFNNPNDIEQYCLNALFMRLLRIGVIWKFYDNITIQMAELTAFSPITPENGNRGKTIRKVKFSKKTYCPDSFKGNLRNEN